MDYNSPQYLDSFKFNPPNDNLTPYQTNNVPRQYSAMSNIPIETTPDTRFQARPTSIPQRNVPTLTTGNNWGYNNRFDAKYNNGRTNGGRMRLMSRRRRRKNQKRTGHKIMRKRRTRRTRKH